MNETEAARHQREIARINAMQYADQAVRDAAIQRENERYEKALASGKKKHAKPVMMRPPGYCCSTVSNRHRWKDRLLLPDSQQALPRKG